MRRLFVLVVAMACLVSGAVAPVVTRSWDQAFEISVRIMSQNHEPLDEMGLFYELSQLKRSINREVTRRVPWKEHRPMEQLATILALIRLTDVSLEKCTEVSLSVDKRNWHRDIYIDLAAGLRESFDRSPSMQQLIDFYYRSQLSLCRNALPGNMDRKYRETFISLSDSPSVLNFVNLLSRSYPEKVEFAEMDVGRRRASSLLFFSRRLNKDWLRGAMYSQEIRLYLVNKFALSECKNQLLEPFGTLIRTLDVIGRQEFPEIKRKYDAIIRAYDFCLGIGRLDDDEVVGIFQRLQQIIAARVQGNQGTATSQLAPQEQNQAQTGLERDPLEPGPSRPQGELDGDDAQ